MTDEQNWAGQAERTLDDVADMFGIGKQARTREVLLTNVENAVRRSRCLSKIEAHHTTTEVDEDGHESEVQLLNWGYEPGEYLSKYLAIESAATAPLLAQIAELQARVAELEAVGEPAFWLDESGHITGSRSRALRWAKDLGPVIPLYTRPARPLTNEQIEKLYEAMKNDPRTAQFNDVNWFTSGCVMAERAHGTTPTGEQG